jgi:hypothetical protein
MKINLNLIIYCCLALVFLGCQSDKLDKSQVENQLKEYLKSYSKESNFITIEGVVRKSEIDDNRQFREEFSTIKPYIDAGLVKKEKEEYRPETKKVWITYTLSRIGKEHLVEETRNLGDYPIFKVKCFDIEFGEITGIREINPSQYVVEFSIKKMNVTPFGELQKYQKIEANLNALYTKYDDGWRLMNVIPE